MSSATKRPSEELEQAAAKRPCRQQLYRDWWEAQQKRLTEKKVTEAVRVTLEDLLETGGSDLKWSTRDVWTERHAVHFAYSDGKLEIWSLSANQWEWSLGSCLVNKPVASANLESSIREWIEENGCCRWGAAW